MPAKKNCECYITPHDWNYITLRDLDKFLFITDIIRSLSAPKKRDVSPPPYDSDSCVSGSDSDEDYLSETESVSTARGKTPTRGGKRTRKRAVSESEVSSSEDVVGPSSKRTSGRKGRKVQKKDEEGDEEEVSSSEDVAGPSSKRTPARKGRKVQKKDEEGDDEEEIIDMSSSEKLGYPKKTYKLSDKNFLKYGNVTIPKCKKTGNGPWTYEAVTFERKDEGNKKKKTKTWTFSIHAKHHAKIQEITTKAMIANGLTPYTGK